MLLLILIDLLFVFILSVVMTFIQIAALEDLTAMMEMGGEATMGLANMDQNPEQVISGVQQVTRDEDFQRHLRSATKLLLMMVFSGYLIWTLFQGLAWWLVHRLVSERKQSYLRYMKNFAGQSIIVYGGFVIILGLWVKFVLSSQIAVMPWISMGTINLIFWTIAGIWWYFGLLSYTMVSDFAYRNTKEAFRFGVKKALYTAQTIIVIAIMVLMIHLIAKIPWIAKTPPALLIVGVFLLMPLFSFTRLMLFETRKMHWPYVEIEKKPKPEVSGHRDREEVRHHHKHKNR
ncbi:TPA: hypothetical protein HA265_03500 [Candidatus Woesearchaeota archaeon]|nr:hypothetical protein [Candidatus Woesearchaeota archaeon]